MPDAITSQSPYDPLACYPSKHGTLTFLQPNLLESLYESKDAVPKKLDSEAANSLDIAKKSYLNDESLFRFDFNEETMAVEKLREGISKFAADAVTLKGILKEKLEA